jgi:hypothetical protein
VSKRKDVQRAVFDLGLLAPPANPPATPPPHSRLKRKWSWLEEYAGCRCSNVTRTKRTALGYCPTHGGEWKRLTLIPGDMEVGYVRG